MGIHSPILVQVLMLHRKEMVDKMKNFTVQGGVGVMLSEYSYQVPDTECYDCEDRIPEVQGIGPDILCRGDSTQDLDRGLQW